MSKIVNEISDLVGKEISGVSFVHDYVEFHFGGQFPILRSISNPYIISEGSKYCFPASGSRDAFCRVIGSTVRVVNLEENRMVELTTSNDCRIVIPLDPKNFRGGEAMHFVPKRDGIQVW
jgi:hypothetical protein